ncbi:hypothetical protein [Paraburkholderia flava]|nr:hypothetical protein [Paraburkholderia flava]
MIQLPVCCELTKDKKREIKSGHADAGESFASMRPAQRIDDSVTVAG